MSGDVISGDDDEDIDAPDWDDLEFFAKLLRDAHSGKKRLRGAKGAALRKLANLEDEIAARAGRKVDRAHLWQELWTLNGTSREEGPLGPGQFAWRSRGRPSGSQMEIHLDKDLELIERACTYLQAAGSVGAALRRVIEEERSANRLVYPQTTEAIIRRLRRKANRLKLLPPRLQRI